MSAPFVSQQQKQQQQQSSSSSTTTTAAPDITCNHSKLYFPKSVPSAETKIENVLLITNNSSAPVIWKMRRSPNTPFLVHPTNGVIHPREERRISITCTGEQLQPLLAAAQENPKTWSEKLQLNSRFFHESDNRENISECWTNKKADSAMKKTKIDLPVVFADASSTTAAAASGNSNKAAAQNTNSAKPETPSRDQQNANNTNNNDSTIANDGSPMVNKPTTAASSQARQPSLIQSSPQTAARQSVQPNTNSNTTGNNAEFTAGTNVSPATQQNNSKPNPFNTTASSNTASLRQEASLQSVAASRPESPVNNNNNNNMQTSSANNNTSTIAKPQHQQQQQQPSVSATSSTSSVEQKTKKSFAEKILLATMPVYVFVPLLVIAFSLGAKMGGGGGGVVVDEQKGKQQQQPKK